MPVGHVPSRVTQLMALNTLVGRVVYRSPILIAAFFARPHGALCATVRGAGPAPTRSEARTTEATCGPSRPKGLVMGTQGHKEHPAAA